MTEKIRIDQYGAFSVNRVGGTGSGFPLSLKSARVDDVLVVSGTALSALDVVSLCQPLLDSDLCLFNIGHHWITADNQFRKPSAIATERGIPAVVHDVAWASPHRADNAELLVLGPLDAAALLADWGLYDIDLIDMSPGGGVEELEALVLAVNTWTRGDPPVLSGTRSSTVYAHVHDDCYFQIEMRDPRLPHLLLSGLLARYVGAVLLTGSEAPIEVAEPPSDLVDGLLATSSSWTGACVSRDADQVIVGLATTSWTLGDAIPSVEQTISYDPATFSWLAQ